MYPNRKNARLINAAGQAYRFCSEIQKGDEVLTYDAGRRQYFVGVVEGDVTHHPGDSAGHDLDPRRIDERFSKADELRFEILYAAALVVALAEAPAAPKACINP